MTASAPAVRGPGLPRGPIWREPHLVLAVTAAVVIACELAAQAAGTSAPMVLAAAVAFAAFVLVWREQERLRVVPLLGVTLAFQLGWIAVHLGVGLESFDSQVLYRRWGNELLDGRYPDAQYPPGAVLLFALEAWVGGGATRTSNALLMVPFHLLTVAAVWALRTRTTPWLAALVALWPMNAFFWEFRFDLVPTALLAVGLLLASRDRWGLSGAALGLGAAVKWFPALSLALLAVWLLASRRTREFGAHAAAFVAVFVGLHLPFLLWSFDHATYSYRYFGGQGITGESVWYLLLNPLGLATVNEREFWLPADVPAWGDPLVVVVQALLLLGLAAATVHARGRLHAALVIAAMAPVVFLLTNRIFSPQYLVPILAAWAIAGAVILESPRRQLMLGIAAMVATTANAFVYPYTFQQLGLWKAASAVLFVVGLSATAAVVVYALDAEAPKRGPHRHRYPPGRPLRSVPD
jgi:Glycosyltransferase family 87